MTILIVKGPSGPAVDRINGSVCVNGSELCWAAGAENAVLTYPDNRIDLTPTEISIFVRNYLDEGFDDDLIIR